MITALYVPPKDDLCLEGNIVDGKADPSVCHQLDIFADRRDYLEKFWCIRRHQIIYGVGSF